MRSPIKNIFAIKKTLKISLQLRKHNIARICPRQRSELDLVILNVVALKSPRFGSKLGYCDSHINHIRGTILGRKKLIYVLI